MTNKIYKSAMGKTVDMGSLLLQNENIRAVGNMGVNARGDLLDGTNTVIEQKSQTVQRQYQKQTTPAPKAELHTSARAARAATAQSSSVVSKPAPVVDTFLESTPAPVVDTFLEPTTDTAVEAQDPDISKPGLAGAMARSRLIKQEKEKSPREQMQEKGVRKI